MFVPQALSLQCAIAGTKNYKFWKAWSQQLNFDTFFNSCNDSLFASL